MTLGDDSNGGTERAFDELLGIAESVKNDAAAAARHALEVRAAIDQAKRDLDRLTDERAAAAAEVAVLRREMDLEQERLEALRRHQLELGVEVAQLGSAKDDVLGELAKLKEQMRSVLPVIAELQRAQRSLEAALDPSAANGDADEADTRERRPIGRMMGDHDEER